MVTTHPCFTSCEDGTYFPDGHFIGTTVLGPEKETRLQFTLEWAKGQAMQRRCHVFSVRGARFGKFDLFEGSILEKVSTAKIAPQA